MTQRSGRLLFTATIAFLTAGPSAVHGQPAKPLSEERFVRLGDLDQWISIRGAHRTDPVLLVVHGGPGEAQWPAAAIYRHWEESFVVVQWDQRGAGHTYGRHGEQTPGVTLERIAKDGVELAAYLCRTLGRQKIIVLGHSWGTLVATRMVLERPGLFAAYVGTGQVVNWAAMVNTQFDLLLAKARKDQDVEAIRELEGIGRPDPSNADQFFSFSRRSRGIMPRSDQDWFAHLRSSSAELKKSEPVEYRNLEAGMMFTGRRVLPDQLAVDLRRTGCGIRIPYFVIQGEDDIITPTAAAVDYFGCIESTNKQLILIPQAGHFAFLTAADAFLKALVTRVRPVVVATAAESRRGVRSQF